MDNPETVAIDSASVTKPDALYVQQKNDIKEMRSALLSFDRTSAESVKSAMRNILAMRIYHQLARIIRFTEEMDKLEQRMYQQMNMQLDNYEWEGTEGIMLMLTFQEKMQKLMVDSQKLLDPYLNMDEILAIDVEAQAEEDDSFGNKLLSSASRQNIREGAQKILQILDSMPEKTDDNG